MSSRKEVLDILHRILELETGARDDYNKYMKEFKNPKIVTDYTFIRDQEIEHMEIAKKMIKLAEKE